MIEIVICARCGILGMYSSRDPSVVLVCATLAHIGHIRSQQMIYRLSVFQDRWIPALYDLHGV